MHIPKEYWMVVVCAACCSFLSFCPPAAALKFSLFQYKKGRAERGLEEKGRLEALLGENLAKEKDCWNFLVDAAIP